MRTLLPTFAFVLLALPAVAGSIDPVTSASSAGNSISTIRCGDCPALKPKAKAGTYHVDAIEAGTQKVEIREKDGERKIFRTEAWMGGSPVLFVSKAPVESTEAANAEKTIEDNAVTVDVSARTSAVDETAAREAAMATTVTSREFDPAGFELRVN